MFVFSPIRYFDTSNGKPDTKKILNNQSLAENVQRKPNGQENALFHCHLIIVHSLRYMVAAAYHQGIKSMQLSLIFQVIATYGI
jgi:hypothetical protein